MIQDTTRSIASSIRRFFTGTLISRASGLAREIAMAAVFGTHPATAAFWMAFRFAHLLRRLFGEGALHAAFVPHYESLKKTDSLLAARFYFDLSMGLALVLLALCFVIEGGLGGILLWGNVSATNADVIGKTMLMLPAVIFISLYALNVSLLNCERSFFLPSVAPTALNIIWVLSILWVRQFPISKAIDKLAMLLVFAFALQWAVTLPKVMSYLKKELKGADYRQMFSGKEMLGILKPFALGLLGVAATQINNGLDAIFARSADTQGPAYLWYALRIQQLPLALFGIGLTGALLPPIARAIQREDYKKYVTFLNFALKKTVLIMIPMTGAILVLGYAGINLLYGHGEFSEGATKETTHCLWAYGLALLPMTAVLLLAAAFYAHKNYKIPTVAALLSVFCNVLLNTLFIYCFKWGPLSIALATTCSACFNAQFLLKSLKKSYGFDGSGVMKVAIKSLSATLVAASVTLVLGSWFLHDNTLGTLLGKMPFNFPRVLKTQLSVFLLQTFLFGLSFMGTAFLLRIPEVRKISYFFRSKTS